MSKEALHSLFLSHPVITTDSRDCPAGSIFFALKGDTFDGNAYAAAALEKGCAYAVIDEPQYAVAGDERYILVADVLQALQDLAREHRRSLGTTIVGITGTNGKTTTKELIAAVLQKKYNILYTQGNFNNHIGVPKTLLRLTPEHELAVIEMGANHPGEIRTLVNIVEPDYGLITNVGKAHLEGFGSFEGVKNTKGELYDYLLAHDGKIFIDADNPHLMEMLTIRTEATKLNANSKFKIQNSKFPKQNAQSLKLKYLKGSLLSCSPFLRFRWDGGEVQTRLIGAYNLTNMMAAATVGRHFGVSDELINEALSEYQPSNNRSQLTVTDRNHLIVDTYNANPTSMMAALENFSILASSLPEGSKVMAILGDMRELGDVSLAEHQKVVDFLTSTISNSKFKIQNSRFSSVWLVGEEFGKTDNPFRTFHDVEAVKETLAAEGVPEGYYILIKGSNSMRLFELPQLL